MATERVRVASVHDGDSLRLADGRRVRLIGVNASELARDGQPAQPLAAEATNALREAIAGDAATLAYGPEREDHYGRTLAHVYDAEGRSLEALLLRRGLAFHIAVPPNTRLADCLYRAEARARGEERGVWAHPGWRPRPAADLTPADAGYRRIAGRVTDISRAAGHVWLELDGPVVLKVPAGLWPSLPRLAVGEPLVVGGWLVDRSGSRATRRGFKPLVLAVRSPYAFEQPLPSTSE